MNILPAWKYQLNGFKWPLIVFYIVIVALISLMGIRLALATHHGFDFSIGGLDGASIIFIFVCGLNSFKTTFHMLSANGVSRRTMFVSYMACLGTVAVGMALVDSAISLLMQSTGRYYPGFLQLYGLRYTASTALVGVLWMFCAYVAAGMGGYLITTLYYRMNKAVKLLVSIGVPVLVMFVLPAVDWALFRGAVTEWITSLISWAFGLSAGQPFMGIISFVVVACLAGGLSYLALRRAPLKAKLQ